MSESGAGQPQPGTLYLVATPIGNLADITLRALELLRTVDLVAAEDTRHTRKLLSAHGVHNHLLSYREHNHQAATRQVLALLAEGKTVACVSDAGTPGLSDPGQRLVGQVLQQGYAVVPVPGPSALLAALVASGLDCSRFVFMGFCARRPEALRQQIEPVSRLPATLVFYESPRRLAATLSTLAEILGPRPAVVARELTKLHEQFLRGTLPQLAGQLAEQDLRGEVVLLVAGSRQQQPRLAMSGELEQLAVAALRGQRLGASRLSGLLGRLTGTNRRELYDWLSTLQKERQ